MVQPRRLPGIPRRFPGQGRKALCSPISLRRVRRAGRSRLSPWQVHRVGRSRFLATPFPPEGWAPVKRILRITGRAANPRTQHWPASLVDLRFPVSVRQRGRVRGLRQLFPAPPWGLVRRWQEARRWVRPGSEPQPGLARRY